LPARQNRLVKTRFALEALIVVAWAIGGFALTRGYAGEGAGRRLAVLAGAVCAAAAVLVVGLRHRVPPPAESVAAAPVAAGPAADPVQVDCGRARVADRLAGRGALDRVESDEVGANDLGDGAHVAAGDSILIMGWAVDPAGRTRAGGACALVDGQVVRQTARYGELRGDVATALGAPALAASGYTIALAGGALPPGAHVLRIAVLGPNGRYALLAVARRLTVDRTSGASAGAAQNR
jgi:hypothetical protein